MNLEKKSKQLALEQQKSKSFLLDLARIRKVTAEELKNTVSLVSTNLSLSCNIFSIYFHPFYWFNFILPIVLIYFRFLFFSFFIFLFISGEAESRDWSSPKTQ